MTFNIYVSLPLWTSVFSIPKIRRRTQTYLLWKKNRNGSISKSTNIMCYSYCYYHLSYWSITQISKVRTIPFLGLNHQFFLGPATNIFRTKSFPTYFALLPRQFLARQIPPAPLTELELNIPHSQTWQDTCSPWSSMGFHAALRTAASREDMQISSLHHFKAMTLTEKIFT